MTENSLNHETDDTGLPPSHAEESASESQSTQEENAVSNAHPENNVTAGPNGQPDEVNSSVGEQAAENTAKIPNDADFAGKTADASASEGDNSEPTTAQAETDKTPPTSPETPPITPESSHQAAIRFALAGRSIVPVNPLDKRPFGSWKPAQIAAATAEDIHRWPLDRRDSFAMICGAVSGGKNEQGNQLYMTCIDIDVAGYYEAFRAEIGALADGLPVQRTGGGGYQIFFLSTLKIRNEKLAWAPNEKEETGREIAIETRGEGGYAVLAPSIHPSGNRYQWLSGDVENVPVVSESDGLALMAAARSLDQAPQTRQDAGKQAGSHGKAQPGAGAQNAKAKGSKGEGADSEPDNSGDSDASGEESQPTDKEAEKKRRTATVRNQIIDAFNAAHSIEQMLEKHGYSRVEGRFARPGGTSPSVHIADGKSYHHSSNDPLCDGFHHSSFDLFKRLEHGDDFRAAIKAAAEELGLDWTGAFTAPQHRQFEKERQRRDLRGSFDAQAQERDVPLIAANERQLKDKLIDLRAAIERANQKKPRLFRGLDGIVLVEAGQGQEPVLSRPSSYAMQAIASEVAFWFGTTQSGVPIEVDPPRELVESFLCSAQYHSALPLVERVASSPFFGAGGELCDKTGFFAAERAYLALPDGFDVGDTKPTPKNVTAALKLLLEHILGEVEFEDNASRAHALALMILPFVRRMIVGPTPLHMITAPLVSSGKSYLANLCLLPFTTASPQSEKENGGEWRKSLLTKLVTGAAAIWLDNIKNNMNSSTLDMAITSPSGYIEDRLTGTGITVRAPSWVVWVATANNAKITDDVASRAIVISIVPTCADPSQRRYKSAPDQFIRDHRGQVCGAIITLVRAWQAAGSPNYSGKFTTRFPIWTRVMGGILETVGVEGFLENLENQRHLLSDETAGAWEEFVLLWEKEFGETPQSARELLPLVERVPDLAMLLSGTDGDARYRRWTQLLAKQRNRIYAGIKIADGPTIKRKITYKLVGLPVTPKGAASPNPGSVNDTGAGSNASANTSSANTEDVAAPTRQTSKAVSAPAEDVRATPVNIDSFVAVKPKIYVPAPKEAEAEIRARNVSVADMSMDEMMRVSSPYDRTPAPEAQGAAPHAATEADDLVADVPKTSDVPVEGSPEGDPSTPTGPENAGSDGDTEPQPEIESAPETLSEESISPQLAPLLEPPILESEETESPN